MPSRIHFALGVMSYLSSPLWLLLVILFLFVATAVRLEHGVPATYIGRHPVLTWPISHTTAFVAIAVATMAMLYIPKFLALAVLLWSRRAARSYGGAGRLILSVVLESLLSTLLAPIFMLSHSWFVLNILIGQNTRWGSQLRGGRGITVRSAICAFAPHTVVAIIVGAAAWRWTPEDFWWYLPMLTGPALAIPVGWLTSLPALGAIAHRRGIFLIPSETIGLPIVARVDAVLDNVGACNPAKEPVALTDDARHAA
jgi:membrane glycosyltransferase